MKNLAMLNWFYPLAAYIGVRAEAVGLLLILILIDTVTGMLAAYRIKGGSNVKSHIMANGIVSKMLLLLIPLVIALAGKTVDVDMTPVVTGSVGVLSLSEAYSSIGNIYSYRTGKSYPEFDAVSSILDKVRKMLEVVTK